MLRRHFFQGAAALLGVGGAASVTASMTGAAEGSFEITRSEAEWKAMLSPLEYRVMREEGTERAFSSPLNDEKRDGMFLCRGCDLPLYSSEHKYDSGTGWPSFWEAQANGIETKPDRSLFMTRTECH